jgi:hypothetical protein
MSKKDALIRAASRTRYIGLIGSIGSIGSILTNQFNQ